MGVLGKHITASVESGLRKIKGLFFGRTGVNNSYECAPFGTDANPIKDTRIVQITMQKNGRNMVIGCINKDQIAKPGEHRIYSTDSDGNTVSFVWLKDDGNLQVNGDDDNMVRYSELETAFNQLRSDFNALVTAYNSHIHTDSTGNPTIATLSQAVASSADISGAKIDNVKTN